MKKKKQDFIPDFLQIPSLVMHMNPADRFVFGAIYNFCNMALGKCVASNLSISKIANITPQAVANSLTRLEDEGFIKRIYSDEAKKHRKEIVCLIGIKKTDYSPRDTSILDKVITDSSTDEQNIIIENKKELIPVKTDIPFNSEEYFRGLVTFPKRFVSIIAVYALKKGKHHELKTRDACNSFIYGRNIKVAKRMEGFSDKQILTAINKCEEWSQRSGYSWSLESVEKELLK